MFDQVVYAKTIRQLALVVYSGLASGGGGGGRGGFPPGALFLGGGTFGWGGTSGFKYLVYYSNTDLDPQSAFESHQKCSKVLSECGKCHFRDPNFKTF